MDFLVQMPLEDLRRLGFLSEPVSGEQTGNDLTTSGFVLGSLDYDEVIDNSSTHHQSSQTRWNTAEDYNSANLPQLSPGSGHSEPVSGEQTGNDLTASGIDLGSLGDYEVFHNSYGHPQSSSARSPPTPP
jgi:hypothetical protein